MIPRIRFIWKPVSVKPKKEDIYIVRAADGEMTFALWNSQWTPLQGYEFSECGEIIAWWPIPPGDKIATR